MSRPRLVLVPLALACLTLPLVVDPGVAGATEGEWKPDQIAEIHERAAQAGLALSAKQLWDPAGDERSGGLMRAVVNLSGCTASFISADGLIATNHHCAYGALQANSSVEHDYLRDGFLAGTRAEELPAPGQSVKILRGIEDVSAQVAEALAAIPAEDHGARAKAYDKIRNELVDACEAKAEFRSCSVAAFYGHSKFELHEYIELRDLRLVYAPPSAIGEYGGETDNWMWPRHTGDFALLRAYASPAGEPAAHAPENVPYAPAQWLRPTAEGVDPGDFVAVLGYPGHTDRYLWAAELQRHHQQWLTQRVRAYGEWIEVLEAGKERDDAVGIKVAAFKKSLANRHKNAAGKIAGLDRLNFVDTRVAEDARLSLDPGAKPTLDALAAITEARRVRAARQFLLDNLRYAPRSLAIAQALVSWSDARAKPDVERPSGYRDRDRDRVWSRLEQLTKDYDAAVDVELLASFLAYADLLDDDQRIPGFDAILGPAKGAGGMPDVPRDGESGPPQAYRDAAKAALEGSALADASKLAALFETPAKVKATKDPMLALARALAKDQAVLDEVKEAERGALLVLEPTYFEALTKLRGGSPYADANSTLRLSYATIQGYVKWNGKDQAPQTTLTEAVAKHRDAGDFDLPDAVLAKAETANTSRWRDADLDDVPIAFLADGDTTGGNSGSPVVDAQGQLIGLNFDRTWENVAGDYAWRMSQSRNISVDIRYLFWMLDEVVGADHLLAELGVAEFTGPAPAKAEAAGAAEGADESKPDEAPKTPSEARKPGAPAGCACDVDEDPERDLGGPLGGLGFMALFGLGLGLRARARARGGRR